VWNAASPAKTVAKGGRRGANAGIASVEIVGDRRQVLIQSSWFLQAPFRRRNTKQLCYQRVAAGSGRLFLGGDGMRSALAVAVALSVLPCAVRAQAGGHGMTARDTLPRFAAVTSVARDSATLVAAADDALQGKFGITAPMIVTQFRRDGSGVEISMRPDTSRGVSWKDLGGTVRVLPDGRRVILRRF